MTAPLRLVVARDQAGHDGESLATRMVRLGLTAEFIASLDFPTFTAVAWCPRKVTKGKNTLDWEDLPNSPMTMEQAQTLRDAGLLVVITRCHDDYRECVVKNAQGKPKPRGSSAVRPMSQPQGHPDVRQ